jgi:hypothetical protein
MLVTVYGAYGLIAVGLVTWLARTLHANGALFLEDVFPDRKELATALNRLLVTGFVMLNLGWAAFLLKADRPVDEAAAVEVLAQRLGILLVSLGVLHFANLGVLAYVRSHERRRKQVPVLPTAWAQAR